MKKLNKMKKGDYITIETFDGNTCEGFKINHPKELPKSATLDKYTYSKDYQINYAIYHSFTKSGTKYFIWDNTPK